MTSVEENTAEIASVFSIIYTTTCDFTALNYTKTTTDVKLEQQIQIGHLQKFL